MLGISHPKNPWTLQWKGLNLNSRGPGPQNSHFWGVRILRAVHFQPSNQPVPLFVVTWQICLRIRPQRPLQFTEEMVLEKVSIPEPEAACVFQFTAAAEHSWAVLDDHFSTEVTSKGEGGRCFTPIRFLGWRNFHQAKVITPPEVQYDPGRFWKDWTISSLDSFLGPCYVTFQSFRSVKLQGFQLDLTNQEFSYWAVIS